MNPVGGVAPVAGGTVVAQTLSGISSPTGAFTATLTSIVYAGDTTNPYGGLDFIYILYNDASSIDSLDRLTVSNFKGFLTDVGFQVPYPLGDVLPSKITRSSNAVNGGATIGWRYDPGGNGVIDPGKTTVTMIIQTDAQNWKDTYASVINSERADIPSYGPDIVIPEPASLVLAGLGAIGLVGFASRRRR